MCINTHHLPNTPASRPQAMIDIPKLAGLPVVAMSVTFLSHVY